MSKPDRDRRRQFHAQRWVTAHAKALYVRGLPVTSDELIDAGWKAPRSHPPWRLEMAPGSRALLLVFTDP